ncbi:MAG: HEPN domain-containing protein [Microgenomates group bacterium]
MTKQELREIAKSRLKEAKLLHDNGFYDGAVYFCGYVLETALKARICKHLKVNEYPSNIHKRAFKVHKLDLLLLISGLKNSIITTQELFTNWNLLSKWETDLRYKAIGSATPQLSEDMIKALEDTPYGLFTWIKKRW